MTGITTITLSKFTRNRLARLGSKDSTFDEIVQDLINSIEENVG